MVKIPNKLFIFGVVAAAALVVPGLAGPLMFGEAYAIGDKSQSNHASQQAEDNVVNVQAAVQANVNDLNVCVLTSECD
jgi:hypothetical protein